MPAAQPGLQSGGRFSPSIYAGFLCRCLRKEATLTSASNTNLLAIDNPTHTSASAMSQQLLIEICTRGTDQMDDAPYKCPACTGCKKCLQGSKPARASPLAVQEQYEITSSIKFIEPTTTQSGHYMCKLPLRDNYGQGIYSNQEGADLANQKLLKQLQKRPFNETEEISNSYKDLIKNRFITPLKDPQEEYPAFYPEHNGIQGQQPLHQGQNLLGCHQKNRSRCGTEFSSPQRGFNLFYDQISPTFSPGSIWSLLLYK